MVVIKAHLHVTPVGIVGIAEMFVQPDTSPEQVKQGEELMNELRELLKKRNTEGCVYEEVTEKWAPPSPPSRN